MNWDTKRKVIYALAFGTAVIAGALFLLRGVIFPEPSCIDRRQNGFELGVDCGGVCALRCAQEVNPLAVVWSKAVPAGGNGLYDFVGMIRNTNIDNASYEVGYTFTSYDEEGMVTVQLSGSTTLPLDGMFPVIIQNIPLSKEPVRVSLTINDGPHYKVQESPTSPTVRIVERRYEAGTISRVHAVVMNTKRLEITNLPVRVVLFDANDNAYRVGQTIIPVLPKEGVQEVVITWNEAFLVTPTRIGVYPIFNPFDALGY